MSDLISTEGRVFVAQLTRDLVAREKVGAALLMPGAQTWNEAIRGFMLSLQSACGGPIQSANGFRLALKRLRLAQKERACFVNGFFGRSRSAIFEVLTWHVGKHPLTREGREGVLVHMFFCRVQRNGRLSCGGSKLAFLSWHALARMHERSKADIFHGGAVVAGCGFAGMIMRESRKHLNTSISYGTDEMTAVGVLREVPNEYAFFDVLTALPPDADKPYQLRQRTQSSQIAHAVHKYVTENDSDPRNRAEHITVIPFDDSDYVSIQLQRQRQKEQQRHGEEHQERQEHQA